VIIRLIVAVVLLGLPVAAAAVVRDFPGFARQYLVDDASPLTTKFNITQAAITQAIIDNLLTWRHSGFSAHGAVRVEDRQGAVRLGRYMIHCPIDPCFHEC